MNKKTLLKRMMVFSFLIVLILPLFIISGCKEEIKKERKDLTNYNLKLDFNDDNKTLFGEETIFYKNTTNSVLKDVCFHLYPNAFRSDARFRPVSSLNFEKAYPNGFSQGKIDIKNVKVEGQNKEINICGNDKNILSINLGKELYPDERIEIEISFLVEVPNCNHRFGYGNNTINFGNFYPIACVYENGKFKQDNYGSNGDPFYSQMSNYNVTISYDKCFTLASSGVQENTKVVNDKKVTKIKAEVVRDFAFVLGKAFEVKSEKVKNTTIYYYYYDDEDAEKSLKAGVDAIKTFSSLFGEYPYSTFSIVKANFVHGGMEYPNLVYISDDVTNRDDYLNVIVHETAHQWWYNMVGSNACEYAWLDEGLTEFSTLLFYKNTKGYNIDVKKSINSSLSSYLLYSEICENVYGKFDSRMTRNVNDFKGEMDYVYVTYVKGVLFFNSLEELVGEKNFIKSLKLYFKQNKFKNATPDDLISAFEITTKRGLVSYFDSWVNGKVILQNNK